MGDASMANYPLSVAELYSIEELRIDCIRDKPLPQDYGQLKRLQVINFSEGRPNLRILGNSTFDAVRKLNISKVNLAGLNVGKIGTETFSGLSTLRTLDLSNNPYLSNRVVDIADSLRNTKIETLILNNTGIRTGFHSKWSIIQKFCGLKLKNLFLDHNQLHDINVKIKTCLPNLEILSLSDNFLRMHGSLLYSVLRLKYLVGCNISWQYRLSSKSPSKIDSFYQTLSLNNINMHKCEKDMACPIAFPPNMIWFDASHTDINFRVWPEMILLTNSTLRYVNVSSCGITTVTRPMYCAWDTIPRIETFNWSHNTLQCVNATTFDRKITNCDWSALNYLYMGYNQLGLIQGNICNEHRNNTLGFLKPLTNLRVLDLSHNMLKSENSFTSLQNLSKLQSLDLSSNGFHYFPLNLSSMKNLSKLKLADNNLQCLSKMTILQLNKLTRTKFRKFPLEVDLSGNLLSCKCECIHFFIWMQGTDVIAKDKHAYKCQFNDGKTVSLIKLSFIIDKLKNECFGKLWLKIYVGSEIFAYLAISISCLLYRRRHELKYLYLKMKINRKKLEHILNPQAYMYSAFISCHHIDAKYFVYRKLLPQLETKETKLKFCIAQRNFRVGVSIMDNILRAMNRSKKVIFIISEHFLKSNWCREETLIAHQV